MSYTYYSSEQLKTHLCDHLGLVLDRAATVHTDGLDAAVFVLVHLHGDLLRQLPRRGQHQHVRSASLTSWQLLVVDVYKTRQKKS